MNHELALQHLLTLRTTDERREATAVSRSKLLAAVRALAGCQRCGFVEQVLAAFDPDLGAALGHSVTTATSLGGSSNRNGFNLGGTPNGSSSAVAAICAQGSQQAASSGGTPALPCDTEGTSGSRAPVGSRSTPAPCATPTGLLSQAQLLALVSGGNSSGSAELVSLLQFSWKEKDAPGDGGADGCVTLSGTLLGKPRLLQRFLQDSVTAMQALTEEVGDCGRHVGYPGPTELASTLSRLETQRCHTLERLAAWGVLRAPAAPPAKPQSHTQGPKTHEGRSKASRDAQVAVGSSQSQQGSDALEGPAAAPAPSLHALEPGPPPELPQQPLQRQQQHQRTPQRRRQASRDGAGPEGVWREAAGEDEDEEAQLALAIRLSLQETSAALGSADAGAAGSQGARGGGNLDTGSLAGLPLTSAAAAGVGVAAGKIGASTPAVTPRRPQRTPPRPTGSLCGGGEGRSSGGLEQDSPARGLGTWPGPAPGCSPASAAGSGSRRVRPGSDGLAATVQGPAALGLAEESLDPPTHTQQPPARPTLKPSPPPSPAPRTDPSHEPRAPSPSPSPGHQHGGGGVGPVCAVGDSCGGGAVQQPTGPRLPVSAAVSAAAGLEDATVLVDPAAVAALPQGLRERVEHLVAQLVQVQQRRGRLEHACQHGIVAAGRKLLLIVLQLMWDSLRHAALSGTSSSLSAAAAAATAPAPSRLDAPVSGPAGANTATATATAQPPSASPVPPSPSPPLPPPSQDSQPPRQRRRRYEGLLADLAAGLGDDDMYLDILGPELDLAAMTLAARAAEEDSDSELDVKEDEEERPGHSAARVAGPSRAERAQQGGREVALMRARGRRGDAGEAAIEAAATNTMAAPSAAEVAGVRAGLDAGGREVLGLAVEVLLEESSSSSDGGGADGDGDSGDWLREVVTPGRGAGRDAGGRPPQPSPLSPLQAESPTAASGAPHRPGLRQGQPVDGGQDDDEEGWDVARSSCIRLPAAATRASQQGAWSAMRQREGPLAFSSVGLPTAPAGGNSTTTAASASGLSAAERCRASAAAGPAGPVLPRRASARSGTWAGLAGGGSGDVGSWNGERERARWTQLERDAGGGAGCGADCVAVRVEQAEQLRILQGQLERCQSSQAQLQGEVGRLLDMMAESRRVQEQASSVLRRELAQWQGDQAALQGLGAEELADLAGRMEAALSRVRAAHLQAAAERDLMCPVCWERRKGLVFGCGHQTCCACGEKLAVCPICRELITIRIRVYS